MIDLLPSLVVLGTSVWVLLDARSLGLKKRVGKRFYMGPVGWFFSCLLLWIVAFPMYLVKRREYKRLNMAAVVAQPIRTQEPDLISQLGALADRYSEGALTEEEFRAKKKDLVRRMLEQGPEGERAMTTG